MSKQYIQVVHFNASVIGITERPIGIQDPDEFMLSMTQLKEEIEEIQEAYKLQDFIELIDGLIDLEYFLLGIFHKNGITAEMHSKLFSAVHEANMNKVKGVKEGREGFSAADANKPKTWISPQEKIAHILRNSE